MMKIVLFSMVVALSVLGAAVNASASEVQLQFVAAQKSKQNTKSQNQNLKHKIRWVKKGELSAKDVEDVYVGPLAVGRISAHTWQVELTNMVLADPTAAPARNVKGVLDISPVDPMDPASVEEAFLILSKLFSVKTGIDHSYDPPIPINKVVTIVYDPADVVQTNVNCMGLDLEVFDQGSTTVKNCYRVRPLEFIEH